MCPILEEMGASSVDVRLGLHSNYESPDVGSPGPAGKLHFSSTWPSVAGQQDKPFPGPFTGCLDPLEYY